MLETQDINALVEEGSDQSKGLTNLWKEQIMGLFFGLNGVFEFEKVF